MSQPTELFALHRRDPVTGALERISARERINALIAQEDVREIVRSMDPQTLFALVREAGDDDAHELVMMASPTQLVSFVDLDCWKGDTLEPTSFAHWLELLLQLDDDDFAAWLDHVDPELPVVWMRDACAVFLWEEDRELLDTIDGAVRTSPDGVYAILIPDEDNIGPLIRHFLERIYATDFSAGHRLLEGVRWELSADLMERAYQARSGRLLDLGFAPPEEAIEVYAWLDPILWRDRSRKRALHPDTPPIVFTTSGKLPPVDTHLQVLERAQADGPEGFFFQCLAVLSNAFEAERLPAIADAVFSQLRAVANRVHVADGAQTGDLESSEAALRRSIAHLTIGLEQVAGEDAAIGARAVATVPLKILHRIGFSTLLDLRAKVDELVQRRSLSLTDAPASLLQEEDQDLVEGLLQERPLRSALQRTPFLGMADVRSAATRLSRIAITELLLRDLLGLGPDVLAHVLYDEDLCDTPVELVTAQGVLTTLLLTERAGRGTLRPLRLEELNAFLREHPDRDQRRLALAGRAYALVETMALEGGPLVEAIRRILGEAIDAFVDECGEAPMAPEIARSLLVIART